MALKRSGIVVWRVKTRASIARWTVLLRTSRYTLTVTRSGARVATGTIAITYRRR